MKNIGRTGLFLCLLTYCLFRHSESSAELYQWTDSDGSVHFSDSPMVVPKGKKPIVRQDYNANAPPSTIQSASTTDLGYADNSEGIDKTKINSSNELGSLEWFERHFTYQPPNGYVLDSNHRPEGLLSYYRSIFYKKSGTRGMDLGHIEFVFVDLKSDKNYVSMDVTRIGFREKIKWISGGNGRGERGVYSTLAGNEVYILDDITLHVHGKTRYVYGQKIYTFIVNDIWLTVSIDAINKAELDKIINSVQRMNIYF